MESNLLELLIEYSISPANVMAIKVKPIVLKNGLLPFALPVKNIPAIIIMNAPR